MAKLHWQKRSEKNENLGKVYAEIAGVAATWKYLALVHRSANVPVSAATMRRLEKVAGDRVRGMTDARAWRLTIDAKARHVDEELGVRGVTKAAFAWLCDDVPYWRIAEHLRVRATDRNTVGDLLDRAIIAFWLQLLAHGITDDYRGEQAA